MTNDLTAALVNLRLTYRLYGRPVSVVEMLSGPRRLSRVIGLRRPRQRDAAHLERRLRALSAQGLAEATAAPSGWKPTNHTGFPRPAGTAIPLQRSG